MFNMLYRKRTINRLSKKFKLLGYKNYNVIKFMNYRLFISLIIFLLFLIFNSKGYIYGPILGILVYFTFEVVLDNKIKKRINKLNYEAIFFFQVLSLTLESGRNLQGGIELTCNSIDSEISNEFKETLREIKLGKSLNESLVRMKDRIPSEEINTVLLNITESALFGNNVVDSLNNQIDYLRDKKLLDIRGKINKMPVKVSVISVFFIVPIVILLVLGPVIINLLK